MKLFENNKGFSYDVVFTASMGTILDRFLFFFGDYRVQGVIWRWTLLLARSIIAIEYSVVEYGKRYLNSGLFMGYAKKFYQMITLKDVADGDDVQLYYTMVYLDEKLRRPGQGIRCMVMIEYPSDMSHAHGFQLVLHMLAEKLFEKPVDVHFRVLIFRMLKFRISRSGRL
ncbi:hypothetical protein COOONC_21790 [Cooperia oncophora]